MTIGERIKSRRKELDISADDLAYTLGVSRSTVFRYENGGITKLPAHIITPLARALKTTEAYLLFGSAADTGSPQPPYSALDDASSTEDERYRAALDIFSRLYINSLEASADKAAHPEMSGYIASLLMQEQWEKRLGPSLYARFMAIYGPSRGESPVRAADTGPGLDYADLPEEDIRRVEDYIKILREKNKNG